MTSDDVRGGRRPSPLGGLAVAALALACGCRGEGYQTSIVTGTVTYQGKPVADLRIEFAPADGPKLGRPPATGVTAADGRYTLVRPGNKAGAVAGPSDVAFFVIEGKPTTVSVDAIQDRVIKVEVQPGESVHDFELGPGGGS